MLLLKQLRVICCFYCFYCFLTLCSCFCVFGLDFIQKQTQKRK